MVDGEHLMAQSTVKSLFELGAHFGHKKQRSNPASRKYTFGVRHGVFIIDLEKTARLLEEAEQAVQALAKEGKTILFVGTKSQAREAVVKYAKEIGMPYVASKWLGGTLTNFETVRENLKRVESLRKEQEDEKWDSLTKHERKRKVDLLNKLEARFAGISTLSQLPDALFVVDAQEEKTAIEEARKLALTIVALVDTNANPDLVDYPIPANDDAPRTIEFIISRIASAIATGISKRPKLKTKEVKEESK